MSTTNATMIVVNAGIQPISGTASHASGEGKNRLVNNFSVDPLQPFCATGQDTIQTRNNHEDYWSWEPSNGPAITVKKNLDRCAGAIMVITENSIVIVTSANGDASKGFGKGEAALTQSV